MSISLFASAWFHALKNSKKKIRTDTVANIAVKHGRKQFLPETAKRTDRNLYVSHNARILRRNHIPTIAQLQTSCSRHALAKLE